MERESSTYCTQWLYLSSWKILEHFSSLEVSRNLVEKGRERLRKEIIEHYSLPGWTTTSFIKPLHSDLTCKALLNPLPRTDKAPKLLLHCSDGWKHAYAACSHPGHKPSLFLHLACFSLLTHVMSSYIIVPQNVQTLIKPNPHTHRAL